MTSGVLELIAILLVGWLFLFGGNAIYQLSRRQKRQLRPRAAAPKRALSRTSEPESDADPEAQEQDRLRYQEALADGASPALIQMAYDPSVGELYRKRAFHGALGIERRLGDVHSLLLAGLNKDAWSALDLTMAALKEYGEQEGHNMPASLIEATVNLAFDEDADVKHRKTAFETAVLARGDVVDLIERALSSDSADLALTAISTIRGMGPKLGLKLLWDLPKNLDARFAAALFTTADAWAELDALDLLKRLAVHPEVELHTRAIRHLSTVGGQQELGWLREQARRDPGLGPKYEAAMMDMIDRLNLQAGSLSVVKHDEGELSVVEKRGAELSDVDKS